MLYPGHKRGLIKHLKRGYIKELVFVTLLSSLAFSVSDSFWAVYLEKFIPSLWKVGLFTGLMALLSFLSFFLFIPLIEKYDKGKILIYSLLGLAITNLLFFFSKTIAFLTFLSILWIFFINLKTNSFGILMKDTSKKKKLSGNVGLVYSVAAAMWIIGPLIAGFLAERFEVKYLFLPSAAILLICYLYAYSKSLRDSNNKKKVDTNFKSNFISFFKDKNRLKAYILGSSITFWYSLVYIYMPIKIVSWGFSYSFLGIFLFLIALPITLIDYPSGILAGKIGYKKLFKLGFLITSIATFLCFFTANYYLILILLIVASIGIGLTESTTESYFLEIVNKKQELRYYGPYNTAIDIGSFSGKIFPALALLFFAEHYIFLVFAIGMLAMFILSYSIKDLKKKK